uniref:Beta-amylase n=1 Tax=Oryza punctata TaxID=4537 RepID=A0A0E0KDR3_ORYPU
MEAVLMQQATAVAAGPARRRCAGEEVVVGGRQPGGLVRLGFVRRRWSGGAVRARLRLSPARAHLAVDRSREAGEEVVVEEAAAVRLFVGLPSDVVTDGHAVNRAKAVSAGLRALKLLGVDGVELPVSWAVAQPESGNEFEWAGYLAVADMVRDAGLCLRVSLDTHGSALPGWVAADPDILFTDRSGNRREGCLSFAVDELPVLGGKSPLQAYEAFFRSFAVAFHDFLGSTITDVTVSLGPNGELQYPSYPPGSDGAGGYGGAGEFQCYDKHMLARLKQHAVAAGQPLWGLSGPHDAPRYGESPETSTFFRSPGGSWETAYGSFFLSWYAGELLAHGDRVLAAASRVFDGEPVELSAKVPLQRSRPAEATAGLHGGYGPVAEMFARHGCTVIASGMDGASTEEVEVLAQVKAACAEHGVRLAGESAVFDGEPVELSAKVPLQRSRPAEATAGLHGGYGPVAEMFARHGCTVIASGMDGASTEEVEVLAQVKAACAEHGVRLAGESASLAVARDGDGSPGAWGGLLAAERTRPCHFTYQRMGAEFFSPDHWPLFVQLVRAMECPEETHEDDLPAAGDGGRLAVPSGGRAAEDATAKQAQTV